MAPKLSLCQSHITPPLSGFRRSLIKLPFSYERGAFSSFFWLTPQEAGSVFNGNGIHQNTWVWGRETAGQRVSGWCYHLAQTRLLCGSDLGSSPSRCLHQGRMKNFSLQHFWDSQVSLSCCFSLHLSGMFHLSKIFHCMMSIEPHKDLVRWEGRHCHSL